MEERRRQFIPGLGILLLAIVLLSAVGSLLHDYREVGYEGVGALLWGGAVLLTFILGTAHLSRRVLPLQNNLGWAEGFRLLWRSYRQYMLWLPPLRQLRRRHQWRDLAAQDHGRQGATGR